MKWIIVLSFGLFGYFYCHSQVGINTMMPCAILEIKSSNQASPNSLDGIIIPKVDTFPTINPTAAQQAMMVYLTTIVGSNDPGFYYWDNPSTSWISVANKRWGLSGNIGTNPTQNFIGTIDNQDLNFRVLNLKSGKIGINEETFFGFAAGLNNLVARNAAFGNFALNQNTTGERNSAIGIYSLTYNTLGSNNTATGYASLNSNTIGNFNTASGFGSLYSNTLGNRNSAFGVSVLYANTTGSFNTATGIDALRFNTTGNYNTANGSNALYNNITGLNNTAIGYNALNANTFGGFNTAIGYNAFATNNFFNAIAIGSNTTITANNQARIGNAAITSIGGFANWTNISDKRFKKDIQQNVPGLEFIIRLRPVTYYLDVEAITKFNKTLESSGMMEFEDDKSKISQTGFIAQEVELSAKEIGYDFSGVDAPKNESDYYGLRYAEFVVPLVKAIQEQQIIITKQQQQIDGLLLRIEKLEGH